VPSFSRTRIARALTTASALALVTLLAACGAASASPGAQATATCPPTPSFTAVTGSVSAVNASSVTVKESSGASVTVTLASTTRYSVMTSVAATSLTQGTPVLVLTDTNATTARSVRVLSGTGTGAGGGFGGGGFGGGARGTPRPGANPACARRGGFGGGAGGGATDGTGASGFQGLRGTVDSATATTLTFDDAQGQTYSVALTSATVITKTAAGQASDVKVGANVTILAQKANGQLEARTVTIQE
jgi:hypothetical protein